MCETEKGNERGTPSLKPGSDDAYSAVCDHVNMARFFIKKAQQDHPRPVPLRWCFEIAAGALWSAIDILNKRVLSKNEQVAKSATAFFHETEPLVNLLRHGAVHFKQDQGVGGAGETKFLWFRDGSPDLPVSVAQSRLANAETLVRSLVFKKGGYWDTTLESQ